MSGVFSGRWSVVDSVRSLGDRFTVVIVPFFIAFLFFSSVNLIAAVEVEQKLVEMTFETDAHGWRAERNCRAFLENGLLRVEADDGEPILSRFVDEIGGRIRIMVEIRTLTESAVHAYWTTRGSPRRSNEKMIALPLRSDGQWHSYEFALPVPDYLTGFAFRFTAREGVWEIRKITAFRHREHPLQMQDVCPYKYKAADGTERDMLRYTILNDAPVPLKFRIGNQPDDIELPGRQTVDLLAPIKTEGNLAAVNVLLRPEGFPVIGYPVFLYDEKGETDWIVRKLGTGKDAPEVEVAPNGRMARLRQGNDIFAIIAPIVHRNGVIPAFPELVDRAGLLRFEADGVKLDIVIDSDELRFSIENTDASIEESIEGPVIRLFGTLQSGLLPGVEFLGPGDISSSAIDIEPPYNHRETPDRRWVTMPMAVLGTDRAALLFQWNDPTLSPTFASPNTFDRAADHRMSLVGRKIEATLEVLPAKTPDGESATLRALRRYVSERKFPEPGPAPRSPEEQYRLSLHALQGPLRSEDALHWGYAIEPDWPRRQFADMLSTTVRLHDILKIERLPRPVDIVPGGADIANDTIYFLTGQVERWRSSRESAIRSILALRNPDGSFLHRTRFPEVESAGTSRGYTAIRALEVMEFVRLTGSLELFGVVRESLEFLKDGNVPRGGFYRDTPLHTPDLMTAATLTWLAVWAYEFSGEMEYLELARRFAYLGLPFVYQRGEPGKMLYMAVPKFGGTERGLPLWFGVTRPGAGILYAYALNLLARHDPAVDWKRVAVGILHATESLQYTDGPEAGCLPEVYDVVYQERRSWHVNPCALVSLRMAVEDRPDSPCLLIDGKERYVSPYPLRVTSAGIEADDVPAGRPFLILRNGNRILGGTGPGLITGN